MIFVSALQVDKAVFFTAAITVTAFVPLFTMQGVEGQIFGPMARTYGYALAGALIATFTVTPVLASLLLPRQIEETETIIVRALRASYTPVLRVGARAISRIAVTVGLVISRPERVARPPGSAASFCRRWRRATSGSGPRCRRRCRSMPAPPPPAKMREILLRHPEVITVVSQHGRPDNGSDASPFSNVELFAPLKPFDEWPADLTKEKLTEELAEGVQRGIARDRLQLFAIYPGQCRRSAVGRQGRQFGQDRRTQPGDAGSRLRPR